MSTREDTIKKMLALQDSVRAEGNPKKKAALQKRLSGMKFPTHDDTEVKRKTSIWQKMGFGKNEGAQKALRNRKAVTDSLMKEK